MPEKVWRSIKLPKKDAEKIERIAKVEHRSFSAQALVILEAGIKDAQTEGAARA